MVNRGEGAESESRPTGSADELRLNWTAWTAVALVLAAVCIVASRIGASALPTECGEVSRPNLDAAVWIALFGAVVVWLLAAYGLVRTESARWVRLTLGCLAAAEVAGWVVALLYYKHQIDLYNGGTCL